MPNRNAETMAKAIASTLSELPDGAAETITSNRGTEFTNWKTIEEQLNCDVYFADPYCACGLLREFYPKEETLHVLELQH